MKCDQCKRTIGVKEIKIEGKHDFVYLCAYCRDDERHRKVRKAKQQQRHYD